MKTSTLIILTAVFFFIFVITSEARKYGGGKAKTSSSKSSSSNSGSSYPKQQWAPAGSQPSYGQPSHNYGPPSVGHNNGQPNVGQNYGQPNVGHNYGQPNVGQNYGQPNVGHNYGQPNVGNNYGQPNAGQNYGQPNVGHNYGQPNVGHNYGQTNLGYNHGQPNGGYPYGQSHKSSSSSKTAFVAGAAIGAVGGAYVAHKVHQKLDQGMYNLSPNEHDIVVVKPRPTKSRPTKRRPLKIRYIYLAMVNRTEWNASQLGELNIRPGDSFSKVIVHHTSSPDCYNVTACTAVLKDAEKRNMEAKKLDNIGYNFMIGGDGRIYENLSWSMYSKITNSSSIDPISLQVAFIGDFNVYRPNQRQLDAFEALLAYGDQKNLLKKYRIHGHRDVSCTTCPGEVLYALLKNMKRFQTLLDTATLCVGQQTSLPSGIVPSKSNSAASPVIAINYGNPGDSRNITIQVSVDKN